jgi:hypothetical protein
VALTDDQKAMLRLLAQREEGYEDMASLLGIGVDELRDRVKEALAEIDRPDAPRAPAPTPPPPPPKPRAEEATPPPAQPKPARAAGAGRRLPPLPRPRLPKDRSVLIGLGAGALVVAILAIVLIVGGGDGDSDSTGSQGGTTPAASEDSNLTQAILSPVDRGDAAGRALFGRFKKNILLQVELEGLDPSPQGQSYAVWLSRSAKPVVPVGTGKVDDSGRLVARFPVPEAVLVLVARGTIDTIDVTLASDTDLAAAISKSRRQSQLPTYTGTQVLSGTIEGPLVGAASANR